MTTDTLHDQVIDEVAARLAALGEVVRSRYGMPSWSGVAIVLEVDDLEVAPGRDLPSLRLPVSVVVPVDETAADLEAELTARRLEAEQTFWNVRKALRRVQPGQSWRAADRSGALTIRLMRPDARHLAVVARALMYFKVDHYADL